MKIAFIGGGNMASALIAGLIKRGVPTTDICAIDPNTEARERNSKLLGIETASVPDSGIARYDAIVLAVKPQVVRDVATSLSSLITSNQLVISVVAGIRSPDLSRWLGGHSRVIRTMPNTPALIGKGVTGLVAGQEVDQASRELATQVLGTAGMTVWVDDEAKIDAVTAISGSGPAYVFYFIEALQDAALQLGLDADQARNLAIATFSGASELAAQSSESAAVLRERVTSKGGTTAAALQSFDASGVKAAIVRGALAAHARAAEMGDEFGKSA
ncbi:pyrroline-5-carboxylate reductase [Paraburkholderia sp. MM5482-R1]|uniref:pyrroline-5-carboxylate reductase n=1 Tax=unclassified Paraburkholderia TaxID=2615204 RepID=UPI003D1F7CA3